MNIRQLCPRCKTGKDSMELDGRSSECPYMYCHRGNRCTMFKPLYTRGLYGFFEKLAAKLKKKDTH